MLNECIFILDIKERQIQFFQKIVCLNVILCIQFNNIILNNIYKLQKKNCSIAYLSLFWSNLNLNINNGKKNNT